VIEIAKKLEINKNIIYTSPTDGLWEDNRTDEEQIGTTYSKLEWAMNFHGDETNLSFDEKNTLEIFRDLNKKNKHKMIPIPMYQKKIID
jgi:NAD+ synthase